MHRNNFMIYFLTSKKDKIKKHFFICLLSYSALCPLLFAFCLLPSAFCLLLFAFCLLCPTNTSPCTFSMLLKNNSRHRLRAHLLRNFLVWHLCNA
ncbi:hypothetical protein EFY79_16110 [Hanamia caeni]|uniref:Uncharacterized protein n=1 Tax=Hanamia caeni TaxID=2294116 RepID=A0A3M9N8T5_9BACT|nr:hypothetical protein EFY79_16110 [Hanamia caeni]